MNFWHHFCSECGHISLSHRGQGCEQEGCSCELSERDLEEQEKAERLGDRDREEPEPEPDDWPPPEPHGQPDLFTNTVEDAAKYEWRRNS